MAPGGGAGAFGSDGVQETPSSLARSVAGPPNVVRRDGAVWHITYHGKAIRMPDAKGLRDIATLLARPGEPVPAAQLAGLVGGRSRRLGDDSERARKAVTARIHHAIGRLRHYHPDQAAHLRAAIRTGTACTYQPAEPVDWDGLRPRRLRPPAGRPAQEIAYAAHRPRVIYPHSA